MIDKRDDGPARHIALAHDWLYVYRGGEAVLDRIAGLVGAECDAIFTLFDTGVELSPAIDRLERIVSPLNRFPNSLRRWLLPLYPAGVSSLSRTLARRHGREPIDLVISTSSAAIKGLKAPPGVAHLCYCHSPARYVWSRQDEYSAGLRGIGLGAFGPWFRRWDRASANNVTRFLANSTHTQAEIMRCYGRESTVLHPPVRTELLTPGGSRETFWLAVGALEPYKRFDLAIRAANDANHPLRVVGTGTMEKQLRERAGSTVEMLGRVDDDELLDLYRRASVLLFPQVEDFGIVAAEAQACGLPVVALRAGGALDIVVDGVSGAFFDRPNVESLLEAVERAPRNCDEACRTNGLRFSEAVFDERMRAVIDETIDRAVDDR